MARGVADARRRAEINNQPPQSEEDYLNSVLPGNRTNTTGLSQGTPVNPANPFGPRVSRPEDKPGFRTTGSTPPVM